MAAVTRAVRARRRPVDQRTHNTSMLRGLPVTRRLWARLPRPVRWWLRPRRLVATVLAGVLLLAALVGGSVGWVRHAANGHLYAAGDVPAAPVALVFGAEIYPSGQPSPYVVGRLTVAQRLLASGRVRALLVTGDHGQPYYDEPDRMRDWLVAHGVPRRKIALDYAGFDTYQSCARARQVFGVRRAILVSQDFHVPRAVALCRSVGIDADAVGDTGQAHTRTYWRGWLRDQLADVKAIYSMVVQPDPAYLGRRETTVREAVTA